MLHWFWDGRAVFSEVMANVLRCYLDRDKISTVMHSNCQADEFGEHRKVTAVGSDDQLFPCFRCSVGFPQFLEHFLMSFRESSFKGASHSGWHELDELIHGHFLEFFEGFSSISKFLSFEFVCGHILLTYSVFRCVAAQFALSKYTMPTLLLHAKMFWFYERLDKKFVVLSERVMYENMMNVYNYSFFSTISVMVSLI
jgi:hypothetical protein